MDTQPRHVSTVFQINIFIVTVLIFILLLHKPICHFNSYDKAPDLIPLSKEELAAIPTHVKVGLNILSFSKADLIKNDFIFEGSVWFEFDEKQIPLDSIKKFVIERGEIINQSEPVIRKIGNLTCAQFFIRAHFETDLNYQGYPLDDHRIAIIITNRTVSAETTVFKASNDTFTHSKDAHIQNCTLENNFVQYGYTQTDLALSKQTSIKTPRVIFSLDCNRIDIRHFLNVFLPLLLIFFLTLFAFSFDFEEHGTTVPTIAASGVPALLAYRFVIESVSPDVDYFMLSDHLFFLFLFLVFMIFIFIASALHSSQKVKKAIIIGLYACMLISCAMLFNSIV